LSRIFNTLRISWASSISHQLLGLRDQTGKSQPHCVRKLPFSSAKDSDGLPYKRLKLDEGNTVENTGD